MDGILEYTLCHGSENRFVMVDGVRDAGVLNHTDPGELARTLCRPRGLCPDRLDGLLLLCTTADGYAMRMFNTDGSEAEMCGNGIRCVARMVRERYLQRDEFPLWSGGRRYAVRHERPLFGSLATYSVEIGIRTAGGDDFPRGGERFVAQPIPELDEELRFTYLNLGNPHLVAETEAIDFARLERMGERVKELKEVFPRGINCSIVRREGGRRLFAATYERGVGLTNSCGTAMTASTTAVWLTGGCPADTEIEVRNRGGMVRCCVHPSKEGLSTRLTGNATYVEAGRIVLRDGAFRSEPLRTYADEQREYARFVESIKE